MMLSLLILFLKVGLSWGEYLLIYQGYRILFDHSAFLKFINRYWTLIVQLLDTFKYIYNTFLVGRIERVIFRYRTKGS